MFHLVLTPQQHILIAKHILGAGIQPSDRMSVMMQWSTMAQHLSLAPHCSFPLLEIFGSVVMARVIRLLQLS